MFLRTAVFKKLLKEAYRNNNLFIAHPAAALGVESGLLISNRSTWFAWIEDGCITKECLAALIEIVGTLPYEGEMYIDGAKEGKITPNENSDLMAIMNGYMNNFIIPTLNEEITEYNVTSLVLCQAHANARVLQSNTGTIALINEFTTSLIVPSHIDDEIGESELIGPARVKDTNFMVWSSGKNIFGIGERMPDDSREYEKELMNVLETIKLVIGV